VKLYSYVVARDYGFAPNPFFGVCTLATCKPNIRKYAQVGDWVVGTGSRRYAVDGKLVYAMKVGEILTYDQYWNDRRFHQKRPNLRGSLKQAYGDNIYHQDPKNGNWVQADSHHSNSDGSSNRENIQHDTHSHKVLVSTDFAYWGGNGPVIPARFRRYRKFDVCCQHPGHKCNFPDDLVESFIEWVWSIGGCGCIGPPKEFDS